MKIIHFAAAVTLLPGLASIAAADPAPAAAPAAAPASAKMTTAGTDLGTLLDNPGSKAVLQKYIPQLISSSQIDMARSMTLKQLQSYAGDVLTDDTLAKIDADLATVPAK